MDLNAIFFPDPDDADEDGLPEKHMVAKVAMQLQREGYTNDAQRRCVRKAVGHYFREWNTHMFTGKASKWNLTAFLVAGYLKFLPIEPEENARLPEAWRIFPDDTMDWGVLDVHDVLLGVMALWRRAPVPSPGGFPQVCLLEKQMARVAQCPWPDDAFQDCCQMIALLWAAESLNRSLLGHMQDEIPEPDETTAAALSAWLDKERDLTLQSNKTDAFAQFILRPMIRPGEMERYARNNSGVDAKNLGNILTFARTHVQAMGAQTLAERLDMRAGNGIMALLLIDRTLRHRCSIAWLANNVVLDLDAMSHVNRERLSWRPHPFILLFGSEWFVIDGDTSWRLRSAVDAAWWWFHRFSESQAPDFIFDLLADEAFDLTVMADDPTFPFFVPPP